jgi:hypothetical protein
LPLWQLRLTLGAVLMVFSEIIMWQNPTAHSLPEWGVRALLYLSLSALLLDFTVRFQVRNIAGLALVGGCYGLLSAALISRDIYTNLPWNLLVRGMGLQTGAGIYGLLFFILVMQGRQLDWRGLAGAVAVGVLWGIWIKWYPLQATTRWEAVSLETGITYFLVGAAAAGLLFMFAVPRFGIVRETDFRLEWWEALLVGVLPFISLFTGLLDETLIPVLPFGLIILLLAVVVGALYLNRQGSEPSLLANITFSAPNPATFLSLCAAFLIVSALSATATTDADSPLGVITYWLIVAAGSLWVPAASVLVGVRAYRNQD